MLAGCSIVRFTNAVAADPHGTSMLRWVQCEIVTFIDGLATSACFLCAQGGTNELTWLRLSFASSSSRRIPPLLGGPWRVWLLLVKRLRL